MEEEAAADMDMDRSPAPSVQSQSDEKTQVDMGRFVVRDSEIETVGGALCRASGRETLFLFIGMCSQIESVHSMISLLVETKGELIKRVSSSRSWISALINLNVLAVDSNKISNDGNQDKIDDND